MARRLNFAFLLTLLLLLARATSLGQEMIVPAGAILQCTLEDANLSSKTAEMNDPIVCDVGSLREFGAAVFPYGAYLEGRFADAREPGRLWGKGWMQLEFDRILLPNAELPISAKVTSVPHLKVDKQGKIHGAGHARRDAVEWAIPVLWPVKVLTLPARGPRPELKNEARISLKLMESISVPFGPMDDQAMAVGPGAFRFAPASQQSSHPGTGELPKSPAAHVGSIPMFWQASWVSTTTPDRASTEGTLLILRDGSAQLAKDYWFDAGQTVRFVAAGGKTGVLPIEALDFAATVRLNQERGVSFVIGSKNNGK